MRKFTKEDYEAVKKYEHHFDTAIDSSFVTGLQSIDLKLIAALYFELLDRRANISCGSCVLDMMRSVGRLYRDYKNTKIKNRKNGKDKKTEN